MELAGIVTHVRRIPVPRPLRIVKIRPIELDECAAEALPVQPLERGFRGSLLLGGRPIPAMYEHDIVVAGEERLVVDRRLLNCSRVAEMGEAQVLPQIDAAGTGRVDRVAVVELLEISQVEFDFVLLFRRRAVGILDDCLETSVGVVAAEPPASKRKSLTLAPISAN